MRDMTQEYDPVTETAATPDATAELRAAREAKRQKQIRDGYAWMYAAAAMGGGHREEDQKELLVVNMARNFCVLFAFTAPVFLMARLLFGN